MSLVSIIVPVFNRPQMLREAVESASAQTHRDCEILIVDDGSTDSTPEMIRHLTSEDDRVRSIRRPNGGPGLAREAGRVLASGDYIQYLDSDDLMLPRKLELQVAALEAQPQAGVAYGITRYRNDLGEEIECTWKPANQLRETMFPSFLVSRWWETATPLYRRSVTDAAGPWTALRLEEDWEYDCRVAALGTRLAYVPEVVVEHRDHAENRLSRGEALDPERLRDRATAHELILRSATTAKLDRHLAEMKHFSRELFHIGRMCGAAGLRNESRRLIESAASISSARDLRLYHLVASRIGWAHAGRAAAWFERQRRPV